MPASARWTPFGDYRQVISLPNPPIEDIAQGETANHSPRVANDAMAELTRAHPTASRLRGGRVARRRGGGARRNRRAIKIWAPAASSSSPTSRGIRSTSPLRAGLCRDGRVRPADLAASGAYRRMPDYAAEANRATRCGGASAGPMRRRSRCRDWCSRPVRSPSRHQDHHAPSRRHDPVFRRPHGRRHGRAGRPRRTRTIPRSCPRSNGPISTISASSMPTPRCSAALWAPCGLDFFGADQVVFATDSPLGPIAKTITAIDDLELDKTATRQD